MCRHTWNTREVTHEEGPPVGVWNHQTFPTDTTEGQDIFQERFFRGLRRVREVLHPLSKVPVVGSPGEGRFSWSLWGPDAPRDTHPPVPHSGGCRSGAPVSRAPTSRRGRWPSRRTSSRPGGARGRAPSGRAIPRASTVGSYGGPSSRLRPRHKVPSLPR